MVGISTEALEKKINELEDKLTGKRDGLADFIFQYITDTYGTGSKSHEIRRDVLLDAFGEVYANWDKI